jgi:hypothetical protein
MIMSLDTICCPHVKKTPSLSAGRRSNAHSGRPSDLTRAEEEHTVDQQLVDERIGQKVGASSLS